MFFMDCGVGYLTGTAKTIPQIRCYICAVIPLQEEKKLFAQIIRHLQQRISLTAEEQQYFCSLLQVRRLQPRQYLLQEGALCRYESYVCQGMLRSFYVDEQGNDHTLHFAMEDWWITDLGSFVLEQPASRNIVALEPCILLQIDKKSREELFGRIPAMERFWRIINERAVMAQDQRILDNIALSGAERYEALLAKYPTLEQRLSQKHIASYLGMTPVFLSRIRKNNSKRRK